MKALIDLLAILEGDEMLSTLLNSTITDKKIHPVPITSDGVGYNYIPFTNDGVKGQSRFEVTVVNADMLKCYEIKQRIDEILITIANKRLTQNILACDANGGGMINDTELKRFKLKTNYVIIVDERV